MFSSRVPAHLGPNAVARAVAERRASGRSTIDLTLTNPTRAGIAYPAGLFQGLAAPGVAAYDPEPFGLRPARDAVAADYCRRGLVVPPGRIVLTSSTSEAYSLLFQLLCDPSDAVLVPVPGYPLFEHLARLDGVRALPYRLDYDGRWRVAFETMEAAWEPRARAVIAVSPHNPTGSVLTAAELADLDARCASRHAALVVDEVFADYAMDPAAPPATNEVPGERPSALTFRLGGLSKSAALPQVKLGWMAVDGPPELVGPALERLELICDTYLSVSTPAQVAAPGLIACGGAARMQVVDRVRTNYDTLRQLAGRHASIDVLPVEAGWSAVLRIPARASEEDVVLDLLARDGILVHPGFFFDFPHEAFLVLSLLPEPGTFREGARRVLERVDG